MIKLDQYHVPKIEIIDEDIHENIFDSIYGQEIGKRALVIAAAGRHNLMFIGTKGVGKSMLSKSIMDLLPNLSDTESLETTSIHSIAGSLNKNKLIKKPPFRNPHSSSSLVSLIGGGTIPKPGEISLAHNGVLFLDELPEFNISAIDSLRTPLEEKEVCISRSKYKISYPANFQLIVAMNPCKCGNLLNGSCKCNAKNYMYKISAPILDRIDLKVILDKVDFNKKPISCQPFKEDIQKAIKVQFERFGSYNSRVSVQKLETAGGFSTEILENLKSKCTILQLSGRSYSKILSVARTISDLAGNIDVSDAEINEAIFFVKNVI